MIKDTTTSNALLKSITGQKPTLFAPPSGDVDSTLVSIAKQQGCLTIMWTADTIDWRDSDKNLIIKRATDNVTAGDLILMHPKNHTVDALKEIISIIQSKNLNCVTVTDCLGL